MIEYLRLGQRIDYVQKYVHMPFSVIAISTISIQELYQGTSTANDEVHQALSSTLDQLQLLDYTREIAQIAGALIRDQQMKDFPDAAIAATALHHDCVLATLNERDFTRVPRLRLYPR